MLWEAILHASARSTPGLRRLGLVGDALALRSRASRQRKAWAPHEARCHAFIARAVDRCERRRTVVVLGSGLLRDVPVARLAGAFERLVLVDAVHLLPARMKARRLGAEMRVADLSRDDDPALAALRVEPGIDLVISANLLSQMPLPHRRRSGDWESTEPATLIGKRHLADLAGFAAPVCLLTDVAYRDVSQDGSSGPEHPLVDEALLPEPAESWDWDVAPRGEIERRFARVHRVGAWLLPPGGATAAVEKARAPA